jgi:hypothetical protein
MGVTLKYMDKIQLDILRNISNTFDTTEIIKKKVLRTENNKNKNNIISADNDDGITLQ